MTFTQLSISRNAPLRSVARITLCAAALIGAGGASAQAFDAVRLYGAKPGQDGGLIGLGFIGGTEYRGSDERKTTAVPLIDYQWANGWFAGTGNGVGYNFSKRTDLQYGARLTFDQGRKSGDSTALKGMGDIDARPEGGVFLNYSVLPDLTLTSSLRMGSGEGGKGSLLDLGAVYSVAIAPQWRVAAGVAATMANADYQQSYFGVTAAQSATSGYAVYTPSSGLRDARINLSLSYQWDARTSITTGLSSSSLSDDAKKSPLVRRGDTVSGIVAVAYAF